MDLTPLEIAGGAAGFFGFWGALAMAEVALAMFKHAGTEGE